MLEFYVDTPKQLEALCQHLKSSSWLAVDTEFVREKTYFPEFCLLQVANENVAACVDPLAVDDLTNLLAILYDQKITKVFHAARQDMEIFFQHWKKLPQPIFDTQLAAILTGLGDQPGYAATVKEVLEIKLDKSQVRTNWRQRPLAESQIRYALDDVIYLGQLYQSLTNMLSSVGRESWLTDDFFDLTHSVTYQIIPEAQWKRIKGKEKLRGKQLAALKSLTAWREKRAQRTNKPRQWILKDEMLLEMARRMPTKLPDLMRIRNMGEAVAEQIGDELLSVVDTAARMPPDQWPNENNPIGRLTLRQEALADLLMSTLKIRADDLSISPTAIASRREIERLIKGKQDLGILKGWRLNAVGKDLLSVMAGKSHPEVHQDGVKLIPSQ